MTEPTKRPIEIADLLSQRRTSQPRVSPDGGFVVFTVKQPDLEEIN